MKKIIVPEGMLRAACRVGATTAADAEPILEAALCWLSENPIIPTDEQLKKMENVRLDQNQSPPHDPERWLCTEWQRRIFLAPEPEVPMSVFELCREALGHGSWLVDNIQLVTIASAAYRLGQKSKE